MSELKRRLRDVAGSDGPPSRLSADEVYAEAFRRRHRRATAWAAGGVAGVVLVGAMGVTTLGAPDGNPVTAPHPSQSADGWPAVTKDGTIISAAATDATHLYAGVATCPWQGQVRHCTTRLAGSDDAGRSWTIRQADFGDGQVTAPAPGVLLRTIYNNASPTPIAKISFQFRVSTDGGWTWRDLRVSSEPLAEVPPGGWVQCAHPPFQTCTLVAVDPTTALAAPLADQPTLTIEAPAQVPSSAGLWVTGRDPADRSRPAVAVSHDRGRTWSTHVFGRDELLSTYLEAVPFSVDGATAYTVVSGSKPTVFRSTDGGRNWQPDPDRSLPPRATDSFVAADGTHIVLATADPPWLWYAGGASGYHPVQLKGLSDRLPPAPALVRVTAPGVYVAFDSDAVYRSADGLNWTRTLVRLPPS